MEYKNIIYTQTQPPFHFKLDHMGLISKLPSEKQIVILKLGLGVIAVSYNTRHDNAPIISSDVACSNQLHVNQFARLIALL